MSNPPHVPYTTYKDEAEDTSHDVSYQFSIKFQNRGINPEQRRALAKLVRQRAMEISVFTTLIAGANMVREVTLSRISSQSGRSLIDFVKEAAEIENENQDS